MLSNVCRYAIRCLVPAVWSLLPLSTVHAQDPSQLPLLSIGDLTYVGAFRLPAATFGSSSLNYSEGPIAYNAENNSLLIVGHSHHQQIAEFLIPPLVNSTVLSDLNIAGAPLQSFAAVLDQTAGGNPQNLDRIGGMRLVDGPQGAELLVNAYEYYDAPGDNTQTTLCVGDPDALATSQVEGFFGFGGGAGHTSGWISPVPAEWQSVLSGTHITGQSSGIPIISRTSVGPSAFSFDPTDFTGPDPPPTPVPTTELLDFSLANPLHTDLSNSTGTNDLWTHLSRVTYGLIVPGTRTYATFGYSGGHVSGVCYKCTQDDGTLCGGYCAPAAADYYQYAWFWDMNDLVAVKDGLLESHAVRPYWYGPFSTPFENATHQIGGGAFDTASDILYLSIQKADRAQGTYSNPPVIVAYWVGDTALPVELAWFSASIDGSEITLTWKTLSETNCAGFEVQMHRLEDRNWEVVGFVPASGTTNESASYEAHVDRVYTDGSRFRLRILDVDGTFSYGPVIEVETDAIRERALLSVSPNPVVATATIELRVPRDQSVALQLFDQNGRIIRRVFNGFIHGGEAKRLPLSTSNLAAGVYILQAIAETSSNNRLVVIAQ